jgi:hypothetical protein
MKLLVTQIEFDFEDSFDELFSKDDQQNVIQDAIGIWEVDNEDELVDKISDTLGWCIKSIDYTSNLLHPLTSYM